MSRPRLDRRTLLAAAAGGLAVSPVSGPAAAAEPVIVLRAAPARAALVGEAWPATEVWAYEGSVPGPTLRARQGGTLRIELDNGLPEPTSFHWHGVRGTGARAAEPVPVDGRARLEAVLPDAGTFWYHPFLRAAGQVGRGLAGLLLVEESEPYPVDRDLPLVLDDWRLGPGGVNEVAATRHEAAGEGALGNAVTVNGRVALRIAVRPGERLRLRLLNAANARIFALRLKGAEPWLLALDGQPLPPHRPEGPLLLAPGQRADLLLDVPPVRLAQVSLLDEGDPQGTYRVTSLAVLQNEPAPRRAPPGPPPPLPANPLAEPDAERAERHELAIDGGTVRIAAGRGRDAAGEDAATRAALRAFAARALFWTLAGRAVAEAELAEQPPLLRLALGRSHRLTILNRTAVFHPLHLHGHHVRVLGRDGRAEPFRPWRDTVLVGPGERVELVLRPERPGRFALHSTVLEHQAAGLLGLVEIG